MKYFVFSLLILIADSAFSTTWVDSEVDDPIKKGKKCQVSKPGSSGSYIYMWPSKYDQVFWPYTDGNNIWYCKKSGFVSFMADFEEIDSESLQKIFEYLKKNKYKKPTNKKLIETLETINGFREFTAHYKNFLTRVYARWHQELGDSEKAAEYREKAFSEIVQFLSEDLALDKKLEYLYLASNYSRYFGDENASNEYLSKLKDAIEESIDTELAGYGGYLADLLQDTKHITPGGQYEPIVPEKAHNN